MRLLARAQLLAAATSFVAASVLAQTAIGPSARHIRFGLAGGLTVPRTGASASTLRNGAHAQGFALLRLGALPPLRLNVDYSRMRFERPELSGLTGLTGIGSSATVDADRQLLAGVASLQIDLLHGPVRPYLLAGAGAFDVRDLVTAAGTDHSFRCTNLGFDGGAGIALKLGPLDAFVEARLQNVVATFGGDVVSKASTAPSSALSTSPHPERTRRSSPRGLDT
jgi:hypothetical protein